MQITRICDALGARVEGIDLSQPLDTAILSELKKAWLEHHVLVFPNQNLTSTQQVAFSENFGVLFEHPTTWTKPAPTKGVRSEHREIARILVKPQKAPLKDYEHSWHCDVTCVAVPPTYSLLYGKQPLLINDVDDDTCFCNLHRAYDTLSPGMKEFLAGRRAHHSARYMMLDGFQRLGQKNGGSGSSANPEADEKELGMPYEQLHPCVRIHPETGRPVLYVNDMCTERFEGWTLEESKPLLNQLVEHAVQESNVYKHKWKKGDLVCWDNRAMMHRPPPNQFFPKGSVREMRRTTVTPKGHDRPRGLEQTSSRL